MTCCNQDSDCLVPNPVNLPQDHDRSQESDYKQEQVICNRETTDDIDCNLEENYTFFPFGIIPLRNVVMIDHGCS